MSDQRIFPLQPETYLREVVSVECTAAPHMTLTATLSNDLQITIRLKINGLMEVFADVEVCGLPYAKNLSVKEVGDAWMALQALSFDLNNQEKQKQCDNITQLLSRPAGTPSPERPEQHSPIDLCQVATWLERHGYFIDLEHVLLLFRSPEIFNKQIGLFERYQTAATPDQQSEVIRDLRALPAHAENANANAMRGDGRR